LHSDHNRKEALSLRTLILSQLSDVPLFDLALCRTAAEEEFP